MNRLRASIPAILPYLCIVYCFSACKQYGAAEDSSPLQSSSQSAPQPEKTPQTVTDAEFGRLTSAGYLVPTDMPSLDDRKVIEQYKASRDAGFAGAAIAADLMVIQDFVDQNPSAASLKNSFLHNNSDDPNGNLQVVDSDTDIDKNPPVKFMDGDFQITSVANSIRKSQDLENQKSILKAILSKGDTAVASQLNLSLRAVDEMKDLSEVDGAINTALARNYAASPLDTIKSWYIEPQRNGYPTKCHNDEIGRGKGWDSNIINLLFLDNSLKLNKFSLEPEGSFEDGPMGRFNFPLKGSLPCVKNQGTRGSCTSFATVSSIETLLNFKSGKKYNLSEQSLYFQGMNYWALPNPSLSDGFDSSIYLNNSKNSVNNFKIPFENAWDYNPSPDRTSSDSFVNSCGANVASSLLLRSSYHDNYDENCSDTPSQGAVVANASGKSFGYMTHVKNLKHGARVVQYESFWNSKNVTSSINLAVHHLTNPTKPLPIVFQGIWTDEATHATRGFIANPNKNDNLTGGHAVAVVGFISNAQVKQLNLDYQSNYSSLPVLKGESNLNVDGFFIVKNSWGTSKGDGGYFYMPLSYVKTYGYTLLAIEEVELTSFRCPSDTIDQGSSCNYTRAIRGSLPTVCPEGSIQKGLECFQPPPAGYDWTTPGGLLIGKICPVGTNDSGTTCWYDRGVGKLPSKGPCASGQRDDGTSCWEDLKCTTVDNGSYVTSWGNVNCMGGRPFKFLGYSDCYKTWIPKLNTSCSGCGCIKTTLLGRQSCPPDQDLTLGFCYPKPKLGTSCVVTHCSFGKDVKPGVKVGTANLKPNNCPAGQVASRGACYDAPKYGFTCDGASCIWQKASDPLPAQGFDVF